MTTDPLLSADAHCEQQHQDWFFNLSLDLMCVVGFDGCFKQVNPAWTHLLGWQESELVNYPALNIVHPDDHAVLQAARAKVQDSQDAGRIEIRYIHKNGSYRWIWWNVFPKPEEQVIYAFGRDITERKRNEILENGQKEILEMVATGKPLAAILNALLTLLEQHSPDMKCSLLLLEPDGLHLKHGAAPSLPAEYCRAIDGEAVSPCSGSCGTAAFRREAVIVEDIANDPLWMEYRDVALLHGLHACWSTPIFDSAHAVLGTFAVYYDQPGAPLAGHQHLVEIATQIAAIAITQHRDQTELKLSEEKFITIFRNAPVQMAITDLTKGTYVDVNDHALQVAGFAREEVIGRTAAELGWLKPNERQLFLDEITTHGKIRGLEMTFHNRNGQTLHGLVTGTKVTINDKPCLLTVAADITERKRAENALREREHYLDKIINNIGDPVFVKDDQYRLVLVNDAFCALFNLSRDEIVGTTLAEQTPLEEREHFWKIDQLVLTEGQDNVCEELLTIRDGETRTISTRKTRYVDEDGNRFVIGVIHDITASKEMETALRQSEAGLAAAQSRAKIGNWELDLATQVGTWSAEMFRIFDRNPALGAPPLAEFATMIHADEREHVMQAFAQAVTAGRDVHQEFRIISDDGTLRWVEGRGELMLDDHGQPKTFVGTTQDITERKRLEAQLLQAQKMEAMGTLAGGIAHDFNNILTAIRGYAQLAKTDADNRPDLQRYLTAVLQGAHRAAELVKQITAFSRQQDAQLGALELQKIVAEALVLLRATIPATIEIRSALNHDAPPVMADPTQIHQIMMNLCTNAWHAMKSKPGEIGIRVDCAMIDEAFSKLHSDLKPGKFVRLSVSDTGSGMDRATLARMFEPFFTTKAPGEGSGLGLAVVHGIMRAHHGAIVVKSAPQAGTTFELYFPALSDEHIKDVSHDFTSHEHVSQGHQERILLVDDEPALTQLGSNILERAGYVVNAFVSSLDAIAAFGASPDEFDLVVSDLAMPGMSGADLAEKLRRLRPDIPIMIVSGNIDAPTQERIVAMGAGKILLKPYTAESLVLAVSQLLSARNAV